MTYTRKNILLKTAIEVYENDFVCGYSGNDFEEKNKVFMHFIITLTKKVNDFRYCSNKNCICSPESKIKSLWEGHESFLRDIYGAYALTEHNPLKVIDYIESIVRETE